MRNLSQILGRVPIKSRVLVARVNMHVHAQQSSRYKALPQLADAANQVKSLSGSAAVLAVILVASVIEITMASMYANPLDR